MREGVSRSFLLLLSLPHIVHVAHAHARAHVCAYVRVTLFFECTTMPLDLVGGQWTVLRGPRRLVATPTN